MLLQLNKMKKLFLSVFGYYKQFFHQAKKRLQIAKNDFVHSKSKIIGKLSWSTRG